MVLATGFQQRENGSGFHTRSSNLVAFHSLLTMPKSGRCHTQGMGVSEMSPFCTVNHYCSRRQMRLKPDIWQGSGWALAEIFVNRFGNINSNSCLIGGSITNANGFAVESKSSADGQKVAKEIHFINTGVKKSDVPESVASKDSFKSASDGSVVDAEDYFPIDDGKNSMMEVNRLIGVDWDFFHLPYVGMSGGILVLWRFNIASFSILEASSQYVIGIYGNDVKLKEVIKAKFEDPKEPTKEIFNAVIDVDADMMVRLVIVFGSLGMSMVRKSFDEGIGASLKKLNGGKTDKELVSKFMGSATDNIKLPSGSVIEISRLPGYVLQTKVKGEVISVVQSKLLCRAYFNLYLGDDPFDKEAKEKFGSSLLSLF
ncbi:hypothetical protein M5K25_003873 [Dendrobium thyrsiflorum]|uniref:Chalcone--flavanone isomerase n=1 Tax=Dendrobium thyrsiflorum TaxID=117978 RepID=A0ABD0VSV6_DENTH